MPIRARMTLWYTALFAVVVAAVAIFVVVKLRADLTASIDRSLASAVPQIALGYHQEGASEFRDSSSSLLAGERAASQVVGQDGRVLLAWGDPVAAHPLSRGVSHFRVASRATTRHGQPVIVAAAISTTPVDRSVHRVIMLLLFALPAGLILTAAGGWWLAGRSLRPVETMTVTAAAIDAGRLEGRVSQPRTHDEVGRLATTLNAMLDRVEAGVNEQRRLVADASHELRTPLAAMRTELDVSLRMDDLSPEARRVLESVRDEVDALARTVANLLTLARVDAGELELRRVDVDLLALAGEVADAVRPVAAAKDVTLTVDGDHGTASADPAAMRHVLRNLVENAIEFSPPGGQVAIDSYAVNGVVRLTVSDSGPGVPVGARDRVFERFYRADPSRSRRTGGSGLGLAIARELVQAHDGRVWVEDREPRGAVFTVELVSRPSPAAD
jgi:two-component system, OmpR family, sensor kinase